MGSPGGRRERGADSGHGDDAGLEAHDEVIQLAIVDMQGNVLLQSLVRPTIPVGTEARAIHGITNEV
jgi:DNA polymerase III epsilon subunit-like protein